MDEMDVPTIPSDIWDYVLKYFNGNKLRAECWFMFRNPLLGGVSPNTMLLLGREQKLRQFIEDAKAMSGEVKE